MQSVGQGEERPLMGGLCGFEPLTEVKKGKKKKKEKWKEVTWTSNSRRVDTVRVSLICVGIIPSHGEINTLAVVGERTQCLRGNDGFYVKKLPCGTSRIRTCDRSVYSTFHVELTDAFTYRGVLRKR